MSCFTTARDMYRYAMQAAPPSRHSRALTWQPRFISSRIVSSHLISSHRISFRPVANPPQAPRSQPRRPARHPPVPPPYRLVSRSARGKHSITRHVPRGGTIRHGHSPGHIPAARSFCGTVCISEDSTRFAAAHRVFNKTTMSLGAGDFIWGPFVSGAEGYSNLTPAVGTSCTDSVGEHRPSYMCSGV